MRKIKYPILVLAVYLLLGCRIHKPHSVKKHNLLPSSFILVTIDTLRADHLGCYGCPSATTPHIDTLAEEGVLFKHAYTSTPITLPSHVSIMTGLYPQVHGVHNNATYYLSSSAHTLAEIFHRAGFYTAAFVGAYVLHARYGLNQGFDLYNDKLPQGEQGIESLYNLYQERKAEETTALALEWLAQNRERPCFLWVHYFEPHAPYLPPASFARQYIDHPYDGEIAYVDHCFGQLVQGIREMNMYDRTSFILTSDHGEGLGEHNETTHGVFLYDSTIHIPLIMKLPGIPTTLVSELNRNIDIFPTILDYYNLSYSHTIQGVSLLPLLFGEERDLGLELIMESHYSSENFGWSPLEGIRNDYWKYIQAPQPELYDLARDPQEAQNLWADQPEQAQKREAHWRKVCSRLEKEKVFETKNAALTPEIRKQMRSLGYVWLSHNEQNKGKNRENPLIDPKQMAPLLDKLDKGVLYYTAGKYEQAIEELKKLIHLNPENSMAHFHLGCAYFLQGNLPLAKDHFTLVTSLDERHVDAYNYLGYIDAQLNNFSQAEEAFARSLALNPQYEEVHYNLGIVYYRQRRLQKSADEFLLATQLNPSHMEAWYNLGNLYLEREKLIEAEKILQQALALQPDHPQTQNSLGKLYNKQKEYNKAEQQFLGAIRADPSFKEAYNNLASVYIHQKKFNEALENLEEAVVIDQNFGDGYYNYGVVYRAIGDFNKALHYLLKAEKTGFSGYEFCYAIGDTLLRLEKYEEAISWLEQAAALNPDSWQAYFDLGAALSAGANTTEEGIQHYTQAIALEPPVAAPYINLGIVHFQRGDFILAVQLWQKAIEVEPENVEARINLGVLHVRQGLYELAVERYKQALSFQPDNFNTHYNLAIAYLHQGKNKEAIVSLRQALKIDPEFHAAKKLLVLAESQGRTQ